MPRKSVFDVKLKLPSAEIIIEPSEKVAFSPALKLVPLIKNSVIESVSPLASVSLLKDQEHFQLKAC